MGLLQGALMAILVVSVCPKAAEMLIFQKQSYFIKGWHCYQRMILIHVFVQTLVTNLTDADLIDFSRV